MSAPTLIAEVRADLAQYAPFSQFQPQLLDHLASRLELEYFSHGELILGPGPDVPEACFIVRQGIVDASSPAIDDEPLLTRLVAGDAFPVGSLAAERPTQATFRAVGDVFCWRMSRADFDELSSRSEAWREFTTHQLGVLLDLSRAQQQANYALQTAEQRDMNTPLELVMKGPPVTARAGDPLRAVFERMEAARVGSILVVPDDPDAAEAPVLSILTRMDVIGRVVLPELSLDTPVEPVSSRPVITLATVDTVADAALVMARRSIRHLPVLRDGRLAGIVTERDLFALQRSSMRSIGDGIAVATTVEGLAHAAKDIRRWSSVL